VRARNEASLQSACAFASAHRTDRFRIHTLHFPALPWKKAGVGLARKIGMDEALRRFDAAGRPEGVILCFDADCLCDPNYLRAVEHYFAAQPKSPGCSVYFEHPLDGPEDPRIYEAVTLYELHLRYYVEGLRWSCFPHAFHTIGSSMAVRASVYREQGGMNKRQAGEDFYFLHKVIPLGGFGEINDTRVLASPRPSHRVPFGTGKAVREILAAGTFATYPIQAFADLRNFFGAVPGFFHEPARVEGCAAPLQEFLARQNFGAALDEIRENTTTPETFRRRFFRWFDGFRTMKYIHHARDHHYGPGDLIPSAHELAGFRGIPIRSGAPRDLLLEYRTWQRRGWLFLLFIHFALLLSSAHA
jgi:hypothetical protein